MIDRWLANDWVLRVLSLLLAIGIWISVNPTVSRTFTHMPVTITGTAKLKVKVAPATVSVEIRGPAAIVDALHPGAISVTASVPYAVPGTYKAQVTASTSVGGTQVAIVAPHVVQVTLTSDTSH